MYAKEEKEASPNSLGNTQFNFIENNALKANKKKKNQHIFGCNSNFLVLGDIQ